MIVHNLTRKTILADKAAIANTPLKRMIGLLGSSVLNPGEALIIVPCQSMHMLFMKFAIDVIFVDAQKRVIGLCADLRPFQFSPIFWKSACAIELPAGTIKQSATQIGDQVQF